MSLAAALPALLAEHWGITGARVEPLGGSMNSARCCARGRPCYLHAMAAFLWSRFTWLAFS